MEGIGAFLDEEFESSSRLFSSVEADYFMSHWYGPNNDYGNIFTNNEITSSNFVSMDETNLVSINEVDDFASSVHTNFHQFSYENSNSSGSNSPFYPTQGYETNQFFSESNQMQVSNDNILVPTNPYSDENLVPNFRYNVMEEFHFMKEEMVNEKLEHDFNQARNVADLGENLTLKRKINMQEHEASGDEKNNSLSKSPKKPRLPRVAQKGKRNTMSKKNKKLSMNGDDEENNDIIDIQNIHSSCSSEDDNTKVASQDCKGEEVNIALNTSGKKRASRGAATDPQSLYARRRRERINERLRILQNLVPNGTKVDISTMLEEAVHYVKFLQLQIKLLGSDEMWMFAPIAYNGMDMGLYNNISI